jgi:uncharacterized protein YbjT (DUF2867 family)
MKTQKIIVFGGTGFIGRYVIQRLAKAGATVVVPTRNIERAKTLRPLGEVGQITPVAFALQNDRQLSEHLRGADAVINLLGILFESGRQAQFDFIQHRWPEKLAKHANAAGVKKFVHISAMGADAKSPSAYARTKALGEGAVRQNFPSATILRPSIVFGPEDNFFNLFAGLARLFHVLPLIGGGNTKFQPVYVGDVADAVLAALQNPACAGQIYELGGPEILSFKELLQLMLRESGQQAKLVPLPFAVAKIQAALLQLLPKPLLTVDQVKLLQVDNVAASGARGLRDLGIMPKTLAAILPEYMAQYRPGGKLADQSRAA